MVFHISFPFILPFKELSICFCKNIYEKMSSENYVISKESLLCSICCETFIDKDPRVLPCLEHSFCFQCIKSYVSSASNLTCPNCREPFELPDGDVNKLKKDITSNKIVGTISSESKLCKLHNKEDSLFCLTHNVCNLCAVCFNEDHINCDVKLMEYRKKILDEYLKEDQKQKDQVLCKIKDEEKNTIEMITKKFEEINDKVNVEYSKRTKKITEIFNRQESFEVNLNEIGKFIGYEVKLNNNDLKLQNSINDCFEMLFESEIEDVKPNFTEETDISKNWTRETSSIVTKSTDKSYRVFLLFSLESISFKSYIKAIQNYSNLLTFYLCSIKITNEDFTELCNALENFAHVLKYLEFYNCFFTDQQGFRLGNLLRKCSYITNFSLALNNDIKESLIKICYGLKSSKDSLKKLNFMDCHVDMEVITDLVGICSQIESLNCSQNYLVR